MARLAAGHDNAPKIRAASSAAEQGKMASDPTRNQRTSSACAGPLDFGRKFRAPGRPAKWVTIPFAWEKTLGSGSGTGPSFCGV
jgi:hypothetical protein